MPQVTPRVELLAHTPSPQELVAMAGKLCYASADLETLSQGVTARDQAGFISRLLDMGHLSTVEHVSFTFGIEGVSRSLLAQITRHRIASFSVQSQRYVAQDQPGGFSYVMPPAIQALGEEAASEYRRQMETIASWYEGWRARLGEGERSNEDARFVLPNACATRMMVTMNARELIHFFGLRCCNRAQWEIRAVAWQMLEAAYRVSPALFGGAGPGCLAGACPEGKKSCGRAQQVREQFEAMTSRINEERA